jgi:uncharacterized protein YidB (DUF937 family)
VDLGSLLSRINSGGLSDLADSWLGDGDNKPVSKINWKGTFGLEKIKGIASHLGADQGSLLSILK